MKKILYPIACALLVLAGGCSYDDKGSGVDELIPDIIIDTTGIPSSFTVDFAQQLVIEPKVSSESNPEGDFSYEWRLGLKSSSSSYMMTDSYKIAGTEQKLDYRIDMMADVQPYQLWYRVKDNKNGQMRTILWSVTVSASSGQGLLLAHSTDGETSDLAVIQDTLFTANFKRASTGDPTPTLIKHDLYSLKNGEKWPGIIKQLVSQQRYADGRLGNFVDGHSNTSLFRINTLDFSLTAKDQDMFYTPTEIDIRKMFTSAPYTGFPASGNDKFIWNGHSFQRMKAPSSWSNPIERFCYGIRSIGSRGWAAGNANYTYDPHPIFSAGNSAAVFYDQYRGRFMYIEHTWFDETWPAQYSYTPGSGFNHTNIPGLEILYAEMGSKRDHCFIVKQEGEYKILSLTDTYEYATARAMININDAPEIDKALYFVVCNNQPVVYYATSTNKVYSILFLDGLGDQVTFALQYTCPEPIDGLYLSRRGGSKNIQYANDALLMTTYNGQNEGKVWVLPMGTINTGNLNTDKIVSFGGFGRISALTYID